MWKVGLGKRTVERFPDSRKSDAPFPFLLLLDWRKVVTQQRDSHNGSLNGPPPHHEIPRTGLLFRHDPLSFYSSLGNKKHFFHHLPSNSS